MLPLCSAQVCRHHSALKKHTSFPLCHPVRNIHFPCVSDLRRLLSSTISDDCSLENLTWSDTDTLTFEVTPASLADLSMLRPTFYRRLDAENCTDNILACLLMPCSPLNVHSFMLAHERNALLRIYMALGELPSRGHHKCKKASIGHYSELSS